jgi:hypothetical protein
MTQEDINHMARVAGFPERRAFSDLSDLYPRLERFAALVAEHEREKCAKVCEEKDGKFTGYHALNCAALIRARGDK